MQVVVLKGSKIFMLLHELIVQGKPEQIALIAGETRITYLTLQKNVEKYKNYFYYLGIKCGDNVGILSRNSIEYIYAYMALVSLGIVVVPINFQLSPREIVYIMKDAAMKYLITQERVDLTAQLEEQSYKMDVQQILLEDIKKQIELVCYEAAPDLPENFSWKETAMIIYTSGTTGKPKGAVLTHKNLVRNAQMFKDALTVGSADHVLCVLPMYHCFAWTCAVLNPLLAGATITILGAFTPKETIQAIAKNRVSILYAVPSICSLLTRLAGQNDLASLRFVVSGGTTLPAKIAADFMTKFAVPILEGYGLSEASPVLSVNTPTKVRIGSIGMELPGVTIAIMDFKGVLLPDGEVGELTAQGDNVMQGYWHLPEATKQVLHGGWLHTGDIAYRDADGFIFIVDRLKDMIISMGENVYPREIEELLYLYPGIREAAVIGVADKLRGQVGSAFLVLEEGAAFDKHALKEYLQNKLALYKVPREFHVIAEMPKSQTGKILKRLLVP